MGISLMCKCEKKGHFYGDSQMIHKQFRFFF